MQLRQAAEDPNVNVGEVAKFIYMYFSLTSPSGWLVLQCRIVLTGSTK